MTAQFRSVIRRRSVIFLRSGMLLRSGIFRLLASVAVIAVVWLGVLPFVAKNHRVKQRIQWLEQQRIDPTAMFYTDLPAMDEILKNQER